MANRYEQLIANVQSMINQNAPISDIDGYLATKGITPAQFRKLVEGPTIGGQVKEFFKGIPSGAIGLAETAGVGAAAALPEEYEKPVRKFIQEKGAALRKPFAPEIGYEEGIPSKFGTAVGSTIPFFALGPLGIAGRAASVGLGVGAGAGEARLAAEEKGVTGEDRALATALGAPVGLLDLLAPQLKIGKSIIARAAVTGGIEGATEAAQKVSQNLIAKGIYDPEQPIFAGAGEEGAYGAGAGALTRFLIDAALGRRARGAPGTQPPGATKEGSVGLPSEARQLPLGQVPEFTEGYEGYRAAPEPFREAEEKEAARQNRLFQITELRDQHDVLMREVDRLRGQFETATSDEQKVAILGRANELNTARADLETQIKQLSKGLEGAERAGAAPEPGQMALDFDMPAMPRQRTGEGVVLGEDEEAAPAGLTSEQTEFFRQQRLQDIQGRLDAGELVTPADIAFLRMDEREQRASLEAQPTPELYTGALEAGEPQTFTLPEEITPSGFFQLQPSNIPQIQVETTEVEPTETRPVTEADFKVMGVGKTNKKLREAIMDKDLADPAQRAEVQEVLTDFANNPNRSPKLIEGVNNFLSSPVFMEQGELDLRPARKPRAKKAKEPVDAVQPTETIEPAVEPSTAMVDERGAPPTGGTTAPVSGGVDVAGGITEQSDVGAAAQPTALETPTEGRVPLNEAINQLIFGANLKRSEATNLARSLADVYDEVSAEDIKNAIAYQRGDKPLYRTGATGTKGVTREKVQQLVDRIVSRWKNAPKIQVVQSVSELPAHLQRQIAEDQVTPPGAFDPDSETIFLIADNITDDVDAALTLTHEALGHYGLRSILGNSYTKMMDDIYNGNLTVRKAAMKKMAEGLDKHTAVEEVLAEMAEKGVYNNAMQRIFNAIRQWLRSIGVNFKAVTDTEIRELLANAQRFVVAGGPKAEGTAAFKGRPLYRVGSDAFKKWFGNSVVRNPDGSPKLMYHGTARDIEEFTPKQANAIFLTDDPRFAEGFADSSEAYMIRELSIAKETFSRAEADALYKKAEKIAKKKGTNYRDEYALLIRDLLPSRANVIPVYVSAQNPFDYDNPAHIEKLAKQTSLMGEDRANVMRGSWGTIESNRIQDAIKAAGFDGFYVSEGGRKNLAVYESSQLKSPFNSGAYGQKEGRILYRTKKEELTPEGQRAAALNARMKGIGNEPEPDVDQSYLDRLTLLADKAKGLPMKFRQAVVDKDAPVKEQIAAAFQNKVTDSLGNIRPDIMNEQAQEAAGLADQLMRKGGVRISKDGLVEAYDRVENGQQISLDRVFEIITEELGAKLGSAKTAITLAHRAFIAQRANELNKRAETLRQQAEAAEAKGNKNAAKLLRKQIVQVRASQEEIDAGLEAMREFPELKQAFDVFTKYNEGITDFLVDMGRLSPAEAQSWKDNIGYVPWTRIEEEDSKVDALTKIRTGNVHLTTLPTLDKEGSSKEIRNVLDNMVGHSIWAMRSGLKNRAAIKTLEALPSADELKTQDEVDRELKNNRQLVVFAYRDGERVAFRLQNQEDLAAFSNVIDVAGPMLGLFKTAATGLRSFVTHMPTFALSQLAQDTGRAMFLSGVKHPFALPTQILGNFYKAVTGSESDIQALGITGAYDGMPEHVMRKMRERHGLQDRAAIGRFWDKLEDFSLAADMAVRASIYDQTMKETGDRVLAFHRAKEYINFKTAGNGQTVRILRQIVPFMNAYIQGMDVLYRTMQGKGLSMEDRKTAMALFYGTGAKVAALSMLYAALVGDDDDYQGLDDRERDFNFILPGTGLKLPVAPEIGFLFKVIPERIYQKISREGTERPIDNTTFLKGMRDAAINAYGGVNITPQLIKPAIEVATNYSFFTNNPIVGINMAGKETYLQFNDRTSELAKLFGYIGISPMKVDYLLRGYLGTVGGVLLDTTDAVADPNRMAKPINKLPLIKTFMYDDTGRGYKTEFYDFRERVDKVVNSVNTFKREGRLEELQDYLTEDKMNLYAMKGVVNKIEDQLGKLRQYRNIIANDPDLSSSEKREKVDEILQLEKELLKNYNVPQLKQMAGM
jgi:hypothetical protein